MMGVNPGAVGMRCGPIAERPRGGEEDQPVIDQLPVSDTEPSPEASTAARPRTRRAILAGALGGLGAWAASAAARVSPTRAAAGSNLILGSSTNNAGTSNTILSTSSSVVAFELLQNGPGTGLMGYATAASGGTRGVYGRSNSPNGDGVQARNAGAAGTGAAMRAFGGNNIGLVATSDTTTGVQGISTSSYGVLGQSNESQGTGIYGNAPGTSADNYGVYGRSESFYGYGVYGSGPNFAGYFAGNVTVTNNIAAASASASIKSFRIDHPLDPANQTLMHSCVESNERKLVYDGVMTTDARGEASIELPAYFGALNADVRYQLTVIGSFAQAIVKTEIKNNRFVIASSDPKTKVCWQVTGIRQDAYAKAHPLVVEAAKTGKERGKYFNPIEHGQPASVGVDYERQQTAKAMHP
jgi:hypothetical protein